MYKKGQSREYIRLKFLVLAYVSSLVLMFVIDVDACVTRFIAFHCLALFQRVL